MLVKTRAFQPFGEKKKTIKGEVKASGSILSMNPDGSGLEVYAWGLRNPYGVQRAPDGKLYVTDNPNPIHYMLVRIDPKTKQSEPFLKNISPEGDIGPGITPGARKTR